MAGCWPGSKREQGGSSRGRSSTGSSFLPDAQGGHMHRRAGLRAQGSMRGWRTYGCGCQLRLERAALAHAVQRPADHRARAAAVDQARTAGGRGLGAGERGQRAVAGPATTAGRWASARPPTHGHSPACAVLRPELVAQHAGEPLPRLLAGRASGLVGVICGPKGVGRRASARCIAAHAAQHSRAARTAPLPPPTYGCLKGLHLVNVLMLHLVSWTAAGRVGGAGTAHGRVVVWLLDALIAALLCAARRSDAAIRAVLQPQAPRRPHGLLQVTAPLHAAGPGTAAGRAAGREP